MTWTAKGNKSVNESLQLFFIRLLRGWDRTKRVEPHWLHNVPADLFRTYVLLILYLYLIDFSIYFSNIFSISLCALRGSFKIRFKPTRVCPDCYKPLALAVLAFNFNILAFLTAKKLFLMMVRTCNHYFFIHSNSTSSLFLDYQTQRV